MSRRLNPELFNTQVSPGATEAEAALVGTEMGRRLSDKKIREIEMHFEAIHQKIDRWAHMLEGKVQQLQHGQKNIHEQIKNLTENMNQQNAILHSRLNERRTAEVKTQEFMDRHNQILNNFETKVTQLQKLASEQELKIMSYKSTYDEVIREIRALRG